MERIKLFILLLALLGLAAGCGNEKQPTEPAGTILTYATEKSAEVTPEILDSLEYEEFAGSIHPGLGGWLQTNMQTWPGGSAFTIMIPPGALPGDPNDSVTFSMRIPTRDSYEDYFDEQGENLPLIIRLTPHGVNFIEPVTVMATWMPWIPFDPEDCGYGTIAPVEEYYGQATCMKINRRWTIRFEAPHFSDWEAGSGIGDG